MKKIYKITLGGIEFEIHQDIDGKFLIPEQLRGIGTALKPSHETWWLVRKPLEHKHTVAANVLKHGTGGINIDASRISTNSPRPQREPTKRDGNIFGSGLEGSKAIEDTTQGRFPANLVLSHNEDCEDTCTPGCAVAMLDAQSGVLHPGGQKSCGSKDANSTFGIGIGIERKAIFKDSGGASRFFYCAKASKSDKSAGLDNPSTHPTVKSTKLMSYLIKLITPPSGVVLDPFTGSGSTGVSAVREGFTFVGIEQSAEYIEIAEKRLEHEESSIEEEEKVSA